MTKHVLTNRSFRSLIDAVSFFKHTERRCTMDDFAMVYVVLFFLLLGTSLVSGMATSTYHWHRTATIAILVGGGVGALFGHYGGVLVGGLAGALVGHMADSDGTFTAGITAGVLSGALSAHAMRLFAEGDAKYLASFVGVSIICILLEVLITLILYDRSRAAAQSGP